MKKAIIIILIAFCCVTVLYMRNASDLDIVVSNNINDSLVNWNDYEELDDVVYICNDTKDISSLLLKLDSNASFEIEYTGNVLNITYSKENQDDIVEKELHYVKILKGDVKSIIINGKEFFSK